LWESSAGVKAKTSSGAQTELTQEMNFRDSNSLFFKPDHQADSRMVMRYTQPLMRGAGATYNRSSFVIANLSSSESAYDVTLKIQQHVFTISTNYWELYTARAYYEQSEQGLERLTALRDQLAGRADLDSLRSQLFRADAQISRQRSQQARAKAQVTASEAKLRAAVGAPELNSASAGILIPITSPADWKPNLDVQSELGLALNVHPNIQATHARLKAAQVRLKVAENELRPTLNLVMEGYARGLNGNYNFGSSLGDQFSQGAPSYSGGLTYQRPRNNIAAKAIMREKRLEMQKLLFDLDNSLLVVSAEVESEIASAEAAYSELEAAVRSTLAAHAELEYLTARWGNAFLDSTQGGTSLLLDQLLNANVQLIQAENAWARAQADHMLALARVRLASGSLLSVNEAIPRPNQP
jgi:outer membrane protein TolC